jgi:hypothetical protein
VRGFGLSAPLSITKNSPIYQTLPLNADNDEIRVLELESGSEEDELSGNLVLGSLQTPCQPFEALSYVWGTSKINEKIMLNKTMPLPITDNLASALRSLRSFSNGEPQRIWINAVCFYVDRYQRKYHRNLRFRPMFFKGFRFISQICFIYLASPYLFFVLTHVSLL